jgi:hypothetical protein
MVRSLQSGPLLFLIIEIEVVQAVNAGQIPSLQSGSKVRYHHHFKANYPPYSSKNEATSHATELGRGGS